MTPVRAAEIVTAVVLVAGAVVLVLLGNWGRRHAPDLVPGALGAEDRVHRQAVLVRGAWACYGAGALFVVAAAGVLF